MPDVKVILTCEPRNMRDAVSAFDHAYHNSDFSGGLSVIQKFPNTWIVRKNKGGYSVFLGAQPNPSSKGEGQNNNKGGETNG